MLTCHNLSYFAAYDATTLKNFFSVFEGWELTTVLEDLKKEGFTAGDSMEGTGRSLADIPIQLLFRMVTNWTIFSNSEIQTLLHDFAPAQPVSGWPSIYPPPGMLLLAVDQSEQVRQWARGQCLSADLTVMPPAKFTGSYIKAFEMMVQAIQGTTSNLDGSPAFNVSSDPVVLWSAFSKVIRLVPPTENPCKSTFDLRRTVTSHLHNTGPRKLANNSMCTPNLSRFADFLDVLRSFALLLKRSSKKFWVDDVTEFPQVVFDSVKDNSTFLNLIQETEISGDNAWILAWIPEFLFTLQDSAIYGDILTKAIDFFCEELQHEQFNDSRPHIMNKGVQVSRLHGNPIQCIDSL